MSASRNPGSTPASNRRSFTHFATYRGLGGVLAATVGPGPTGGGERFYQSYIYIGGTLEIVSIDPASGAHQVFPSPVPTESGAWALAVGADGNVYVGTLPNAHLLRLDPSAGTLRDLGRPSETEQYIWELALGADKKLYGCTYPSAKLVRFDPATGQLEDLGRMDPEEQYARHVAASDDGFVYVGIGTRRAGLVAYQIATGEHREVLPAAYRVTGTTNVNRGDDGKVYGQIAGQDFRLDGWAAVPITPGELRRQPRNRLRDGNVVEVRDGTVQVHDPRTDGTVTHRFDYHGKEMDIFRLGDGPDGFLYGSTMLPIHFFRVDPTNGHLEELGQLGGGEFYSFLRFGQDLLGAAYSGQAPLMRFDPTRRFAPGKDSDANPRLISYDGQEPAWRPMAMIAGPDGRVYLGAIAGYGKLEGPLTVWNPATEQVQSFSAVILDQSVVSLAVAGNVIVGGTTVRGGGGSVPSQSEARLFLWDPVAERKTFETVPVAGATEITDLLTAPNGLVYGIAGGSTLFVFDPSARRVVHTAVLPFQGVIYNSVAVGPDEQLWGLAKVGIFAIDLRTNAARLVAESPEPITAGFGMRGNAIYYASGPRVYRYQPASPRSF